MRTSDPITNFSVYSHGLVGTLGFGYDYNGSPTYDKGRALNFYLEDIDKLNDGAFSNTWSYFYSCNTGTENDNGISFAQAWSNKTGGVSKAVSNAKTDYSNINVVPLWNIVGLIEKSFAKKSREEYGYSQTGSVNYPKPQKGVKWSYFYPKN